MNKNIANINTKTTETTSSKFNDETFRGKPVAENETWLNKENKTKSNKLLLMLREAEAEVFMINLFRWFDFLNNYTFYERVKFLVIGKWCVMQDMWCV